ncbi:gp53-like domain-containing protein [Escherichia coli]|uniref:gp53-like domain-containing protein n=1 Tax=Escherichia coli TaxID=562 RepID=UPI0021152938|nr:hypothetical protein [Escherichia coli]MCQ7034247.1 hypothetical protein [Escherichia coli]
MLRIGQVEATATQDGKYTDGSVAGGIAATRLRAAAFNAMQEELAHIVESAGLALDINDMTQVLKAIQKLTLSRANPFADIKSDGAAAISTALTNLGLGEAAKCNVGTSANQIPDMSFFTYSNGVYRFPNGLILQIFNRVTSTTDTTTAFTFPTVFPDSCHGIFSTYNSGTAGNYYTFNNVTPAGANMQAFLGSPTPTKGGSTATIVAFGR